jgi:uncharacterized protein (PEP-CTERM system associated)
MAKRLPVTAASAPVALLSLLLSPNCLADWQVTPSLDLRQTYTSNVNLAADSLARSTHISELGPGLGIVNNNPRLKFLGSFQRRFYAYSEDEVPNAQHSQAFVSAAMKAHLVDEFLFLDASANQNEHSISAFGPPVNGSNYANPNSTSVRTWRVSPYLQHQFGASANLQARYVHDSVDAGNSGLRNSDSDAIDLSLSSGPLFRRVGWSLQAAHREIEEKDASTAAGATGGATIGSDNASLNLNYLLVPGLSLTASGGYDSYDYDTLGGKTSGKSWTAGFDWSPSARSRLTFSAGDRYYGSSYMLRALHRSRHTVWNISYDDAVTTTRDRFVLPSTIDTASMLDRLFSASIADPVARAQAVQAYIRATGLPAALADNINYFSNRFVLQKQFQALAGFNSARTTSVLTVASTRRSALSTVQADSPILGSNAGSLYDNVHLKSASALWSMRLTGRSNISLSLTANRSRSEATNIESDNRAVRLGMTRQFAQRMTGALELRRVTGTAADGVNDYRENAISASLSLKL